MGRQVGIWVKEGEHLCEGGEGGFGYLVEEVGRGWAPGGGGEGRGGHLSGGGEGGGGHLVKKVGRGLDFHLALLSLLWLSVLGPDVWTLKAYCFH